MKDRNCVSSFSYPMSKGEVMTEFKVISVREKKSQSELLIELIEQYVKIHGEGNPSFTLEQFQDPNFQAVPAFLSNDDKWVQHYKNSNEKDKTKLRIQAINLSKKFRMVDINE